MRASPLPSPFSARDFISLYRADPLPLCVANPSSPPELHRRLLCPRLRRALLPARHPQAQHLRQCALPLSLCSSHTSLLALTSPLRRLRPRWPRPVDGRVRRHRLLRVPRRVRPLSSPSLPSSRLTRRNASALATGSTSSSSSLTRRSSSCACGKRTRRSSRARPVTSRRPHRTTEECGGTRERGIRSPCRVEWGLLCFRVLAVATGAGRESSQAAPLGACAVIHSISRAYFRRPRTRASLPLWCFSPLSLFLSAGPPAPNEPPSLMLAPRCSFRNLCPLALSLPSLSRSLSRKSSTTASATSKLDRPDEVLVAHSALVRPAGPGPCWPRGGPLTLRCPGPAAAPGGSPGGARSAPRPRWCC